LEGRVCASWFHLRQDDILKRKLRRSAGKWMKGLMRRLLQITHQQWTYRNATVHLKMKDGRTTAQHETILSEILECAYVDPDDLLAKHCVSQCPFGHVPCNECAIGPIRA